MDEEDEVITPRSPYMITVIWAAIASVGWYILGVGVALFCAAPYLGDKYKSWREKRDQHEYAAKYHKNPELFEQKMRALDAARQRMQQKYEEESVIAQEKAELRKEQKRRELLKLEENIAGNRLGSGDEASTSKSNFRDEYNPLMGNSSRGYKPPKRSCCKKGGGCG